jgi:hypothetical protein
MYITVQKRSAQIPSDRPRRGPRASQIRSRCALYANRVRKHMSSKSSNRPDFDELRQRAFLAVQQSHHIDILSIQPEAPSSKVREERFRCLRGVREDRSLDEIPTSPNWPSEIPSLTICWRTNSSEAESTRANRVPVSTYG